jgi:hypothetical protein
VSTGLAALGKIDCLERDVFDRENRCELPTCRRRTEDHLCSQHQGSSNSFGVQDAEVRMTTMHADHDGDELSRIRETDVVWKREHLLKSSSASIPIEMIERSRKMPPDSSHDSSTSPEVDIVVKRSARSAIGSPSPTENATKTRSSRRRGLEGKIGIVDCGQTRRVGAPRALSDLDSTSQTHPQSEQLRAAMEDPGTEECQVGASE